MAKVPPDRVHKGVLAMLKKLPCQLVGEVSMMVKIAPSLSYRGGLGDG
jgi:hypothetical protein